MIILPSVTLPQEQSPQFPEICVGCLGEPETKISFTRSHDNPLLWIFLPFFALLVRTRTRAPACEDCRDRYWWRRLCRFASPIVLVCGAIALVVLLNEWNPDDQFWLGIVGLVALLCSFFLNRYRWPLDIDIAANRQTVEYFFRSPEYARQFRACNAAMVVESDIPELGSIEDEVLGDRVRKAP